MSRVDIGVLESCESWRLESRFFPSKVGGKPAWLDLKNIPSYEKVKCDYCEKPCIFLCQIYAPYEENEDAFHRTLFVFVCSNVDCCKANQNGNFKVFRSQMNRENEFYPYDPPEEDESWGKDIDAKKWVKTCEVCGILAPSHCAKCKIVNYCCREHQLLDWKENHKKVCSSDNINSNENSILFPEFELIIDDQDDDSDDEKSTQEKEENELKNFKSLIENGEAGTLQSEKDVDDDLLKMANETEDKYFNKFLNKVQNCPEQVLRCERGGKPLYISQTNTVENVPKCELCGGERQFEFQIMPQMLNHLKFADLLNSLDWGVLLIFTCKNSCKLTSMYTKEYIWKQDISDN